MTENYDKEILHINCTNLIDSLVCILQNYKIDQSCKWRYERLLRELGEFRFAIWGDRLPVVRKQDKED